MRDLIITLIVIFGCLYTLKKPYIGILLWSWLSYMNPHRLAYGFAYSMPFAYITAITLIISMVFSKQTKMFPINAITVIWLIFITYMGITTIFAFYPDGALFEFTRVIKIQLVVFFTMMLIADLKQLNQLLTVIAVSMGYYSVKGGVFTILHGGNFIVWGPEGTFIEGNNELAIATLMVIPIMAYLYRISSNRWVRLAWLFSIPLSFFSAIGTQSRGAFLAFGAVVLFFWFKSKKKVSIGIVMAIMTVIILSMMPESWYKRMDTIQTYEQDDSAMGRINAWYYAINVANDRFLGMGFNHWTSETFLIYAPNPLDHHAAHSIYFAVLGDHGWPGLMMFLLIYFLSWRMLMKVIKDSKDNPELGNIHFLAKMLQISFIAYLVGGAFLSLSYFDLPWHFVSFVIILAKLNAETLKIEKQPSPVINKKPNRVLNP